MPDQPTFVIVGAGLAGAKAAEALRTEGFAGRIVLLGAEPHRPYERPPLSKGYLHGSAARDTIYLHPPEWYADHQIDLRLGTAVTAIDRRAHEIVTADGNRERYHKLLLATGATPRRLPVPGAHLAGLRYLRTLDDSDQLKAALRPGTRVVIIGGGVDRAGDRRGGPHGRRRGDRARTRRAAAAARARTPGGAGVRRPAHRKRRRPALRRHRGRDPARRHRPNDNGWCTAWALVAIGGTQVCLREVRGDAIWGLIDAEGVTHLNGAPTVVTTIVNASAARKLDSPIVITTAGAPPSPTTILQTERMGFSIVHVYGLTETYGPYAICQWQRDWDALDQEERSQLRARQGVGMIQAERMRVVEPKLRDGKLVDVAADGATMGEIVMRGNNVMKGYYNDPDSTAAAFEGGWFHSGDLGVMHPDGYVELRDRAKDVVVSGGENISTVEVEQAVQAHDAVLEAAVIGIPDQKWGERPKAFVVLKPGRSLTEAELLDHVRTRIARYKTPREIEFLPELPKTSTGKVQKFTLREKEWAGEDSRIKG